MNSFDEMVLELRRHVTPRPFYGRKSEATPEQWAANVEYRNESQRRWKEKDHWRAAAVTKRAKRKHYAKHADSIRATAKEKATLYYQENRDAVLAKLRDKYANYPERFRQYVAARRKTPKFRTQQKQRYATDLEYRIKKIARCRLRSVISGRSGWRLLGADIDHVVQHLGGMFTPGMSWDNYGVVWQIDHVFPLAAANLSDELELAAVCNWRNLQPLTIQANSSKKDKVTDRARRLLETIKQEIRSAKEKNIVATA
jgi:hypothetical protein